MAGILDIYEPYIIEEIKTLGDVKTFFPEGYDEKNNWLFLSMQGVHGTHKTLNDVQAIFDESDTVEKQWITVLIVQPRLCNLFYGEIPIKEKDIASLRKLVANTEIAVVASQGGND